MQIVCGQPPYKIEKGKGERKEPYSLLLFRHKIRYIFLRIPFRFAHLSLSVSVSLINETKIFAYLPRVKQNFSFAVN